MSNTEGGEPSEGELEEGEVLSSEDEGNGGETEEGEKSAEEAHVENGQMEEKGQEDTPTIEQLPLDTDSPNPPKASKTDPATLSGAGNSDAEEGEIFSDDEEAAYFPQRIKSRSTTRTGSSQERESEASGSEAAEEKKTVSRSRSRGYSNSPERDSYRSRRRRSMEDDRDSEPKSLATLFFEDRDGTQSELSDDGKDSRGRKKGDRFRYSNSPGSRSNRDRDRERPPRDRSRRERSSYYRSSKDSHGSRERDQDSNVDSSEEESSWSQRASRGSGSKSYHSYQRGGRRGGSSYSKYGQRHDRYSSASGNDARGRQGWNSSSGRINTGMTAQEFYALAEKVRKRREKGLSLLPTPKLKPTDNLDQFNYPAPPSWYLEAVEKWGETQGEAGAATQQAQSTAPSTDQSKPPPLFPLSTQFTQTAAETVNNLSLGVPLQPAIHPLMPGQNPSVNLPQPTAPLVQVPSLFPPTAGGAAPVPLVLPSNSQMAVVPPPPPTIGGTTGSGHLPLGVVGITPEEGTTTVSTVRVSSLTLSTADGGDMERDDIEEEEEEEGRMKIALETPTPQPSATHGKTFELFRPTSTSAETEEKEAAVEEVSSTEEDEKEVRDIKTTEATGSPEVKVKEVTDEQEMEVDVTPQENSEGNISNTHELQPDSSTTVAIPSSATSNSTPTPDPTSISHPTASSALSNDSVYIQTYSPPIQAVTPPSLPPRVPEDAENDVEEGDPTNHVDSDQEMEDSDYDKYLDQLDEEEDEEHISRPSLVGTISASLLQNNPLDEDFPAINPVNKSQSKDVTLKSLLSENMPVDGDRTAKTRGGSKSIRRRIKESEWRGKQTANGSHKASSGTNSTTTKPPCKFYLNGFCKQGAGCQFSHEGPRPKKKERCKFYLQDSCTKGDDCLYYHGDFPCKFFHTNTGCKNGENCKFSHEALTEETSELLTQVLEPSRNPAKQAELAILGISTPSMIPTIPLLPLYEPGRRQGVDSKVKGHIFSPGNPLDRFSEPLVSEEHPLTSPLLISIPKQVLDKALVVSIPRQKLGPPFGTIRISTASSAPPNQPSLPSPTLPPPSKPPQLSGVSPCPPQSAQMLPFPPSVQPPNTSLQAPPIQSVPPPNFYVPPRSFPVPPHAQNQPPPNFAPRPSGWPTVLNQPVPLFPPGPQQQLPVPPNLNPPQFPPGQTPRPPQQNLPPSDRKAGLLPTPPSHLRLDPSNIQWSEEDKPEYWEAPELTGQSGRFPDPVSHPSPPVSAQFAASGHQPPGVPPPSGFFGAQPPPPHVPPAVGSVPQQPLLPSLSNTPRPQQGRMDPRQNRMESRPGINMDPRRGGSGPPNPPQHPLGAVGTADPRHHVSGGTTTNAALPYLPPPGPGPQPPPQVFPLPPVQIQWPSHPPTVQQQQSLPPQCLPPFPGSHIPNHMPSSSSGIGSVIPPVPNIQAQPGTGPFGTGVNPPPFQQPPTLSSQSGSAAVWGSSNPNSSLPGISSSIGHTTSHAPRDNVPAPSDVRPLRADPRTKYSQFKIKSKGSTSLSPVSQSILKGKESDGLEQGPSVGSEKTHMPKLLQEPPPHQRLFDPRELFESANKEETSDYQVSGHFGSKFGVGSFFMRSSSTDEGGKEATDSLPYGEIRMNKETETDSASGEEEEATTRTPVERQDQEAVESSTKTTVPSYLAELGVGLGDSDLTIDSAFSSLDKDASGQGGGDTTQKLPGIFGFGSGTL